LAPAIVASRAGEIPREAQDSPSGMRLVGAAARQNNLPIWRLNAPHASPHRGQTRSERPGTRALHDLRVSRQVETEELFPVSASSVGHARYAALKHILPGACCGAMSKASRARASGNTSAIRLSSTIDNALIDPAALDYHHDEICRARRSAHFADTFQFSSFRSV